MILSRAHEERCSTSQATDSNNNEDFAREILTTLVGIILMGLAITGLVAYSIFFWSNAVSLETNQQKVTLSLDALKSFYDVSGGSFFPDRWLPTISTFLVLFCTVLLATRKGVELPNTSRHRIITNNLSFLSITVGFLTVTLYALFIIGWKATRDTCASTICIGDAAPVAALVYPTLLTSIIVWLAALAGAHMIAESRAVSLQKSIDSTEKTITDLECRFKLKRIEDPQEPKFWKKPFDYTQVALAFTLFCACPFLLLLPAEIWHEVVVIVVIVIWLLSALYIFIFLRLSSILDKGADPISKSIFVFLALTISLLMSIFIAGVILELIAPECPEGIKVLSVVLLSAAIAIGIWLLPRWSIHRLASKGGVFPKHYQIFSPAYRAATILHKRSSYIRDRDQKELYKLEEAARQEVERRIQEFRRYT